MIDDLAPTADDELEMDVQEGISIEDILGEDWTYEQGGPDTTMAQAHKATFGQSEPDRQAQEEPALDKQPAQPGQGPGPDNDTPDMMG